MNTSSMLRPFEVRTKLHDDGSLFITVCMSCHPGRKVFETRPELNINGSKISHGICSAHYYELMNEAKQNKPK